MYEVGASYHLASKVDALFKKIDKLNVNVVSHNISPCEICGIIGHTGAECQMILNG